jgi:hypothetical protein
VNAVVDNDALVKSTYYRLLDEIAGFVSPDGGVGVLGAARFVVSAIIRRRPTSLDKAGLLSDFERFLNKAEDLEPNSAEQQLAADIEYQAQVRGLALDPGESQLCAICVERRIPKLVTADKRAIGAIESLFQEDARLGSLAGIVRCLEQAILGVLSHTEFADLRARICVDPQVDLALSMCFSCWSPETTADEARAGLSSYIGALRLQAANVLAS